MISSALIALSMAVQATPPPMTRLDVLPALTDAEACKLLGRISKEITEELPKMVDSSTRLDGVVTICSLRTFNNSKFILSPMSDMRDGWKARKQAQWNEIVCKNEAFLPLARRGWRFSQVVTFVSGERVILDAACD